MAHIKPLYNSFSLNRWNLNQKQNCVSNYAFLILKCVWSVKMWPKIEGLKVTNNFPLAVWSEPLRCGNMWSLSVWALLSPSGVISVQGTSTVRLPKKETKQWIKTLCVVVPQTVTLATAWGRRRSQRGGGRESCLFNDFFPSVAALPRCLGMKIAIAISGMSENRSKNAHDRR